MLAWHPIAHAGLHVIPSQQSLFDSGSIRQGRASAEPHAANRMGSTSAKARYKLRLRIMRGP